MASEYIGASTSRRATDGSMDLCSDLYPSISMFYLSVAQMMEKDVLMETHVCFSVSFMTNWKWDLWLPWRKKKDLSTLPQSAVGHDKAWTHHWLQLHVEWCKQWQIPSSLVMRAQLIGITRSDGRLVLALGWGAELPDWIIQKWLVIRVLPVVSSGCIQYFCFAAFTCLYFSMSDNRSTWLFQFVIERVSVILIVHMLVFGRGLCIWCSLTSPTPKLTTCLHDPKPLHGHNWLHC